MRRYTSDHISKLLREKYEEWDFMRMLKMHRALKDLWKSIPDPRLRSMDIEFMITKDRTLIIQCPSSILLNYVRRQRRLILNHISFYMTTYNIKKLEIVMANSTE